ncbi:MAG: argininosuccinate lyase [Clostridia bacterium]|nr:argininosuccinate lyase [Clostridia bacterium]
MKMWAGRFQKEIDREVNDFNSSISFDKRLYRQDITGSLAHAAMLSEQGIITKDEAAEISRGLLEIMAEIEADDSILSADAEDIHMNVEALLTQKIGDTGKKLHTARSRNDQVALDMRMYAREETKNIRAEVLKLLSALVKLAGEHTSTVMPGYTHLQRAQPITFSHHLMAYAQMFMRDVTRLNDAYARMDEMPLGSGALAASTFPINRESVAKKLGFSDITKNSLDGVSDRDYLLELTSAISIIMMHLSRFSEEVILWCSSEFSFIELDDAYSTGSSIMPQKKNPDIAELVRGKTGRVYGSLIALLTMMKGLPLAYNKDMQEDKESFFDAADTVKMCLSIFTPMLETMRVKADNMRKAASGGFTNATDCADYLAKKGLPFRDAYKVVGGLVHVCIERGCGLSDLTVDELKTYCPLFSDDVYDAISLDTCVGERKAMGGPAPESVKRQIEIMSGFLKAQSDIL